MSCSFCLSRFYFSYSTGSMRSIICVDAFYYTKKNEQREAQYQAVIQKNQEVIEE
ncbi:hypothetical protein FORC087_244 (plasmid) [Bacillus cereus]|nr:hypothetical protein FORC087_244 [Bacillus cereus]